MSETIQIPPVLAGRQRPFTLEQRRALLAAATEPGCSLSQVARRYGVAPSLLFQWKHAMQEGSETGLKTGEPVVPASVVKQLEARIRELERARDRKTMHVEILEEALKVPREKNCSRPQLPPASEVANDASREGAVDPALSFVSPCFSRPACTCTLHARR